MADAHSKITIRLRITTSAVSGISAASIVSSENGLRLMSIKKLQAKTMSLIEIIDAQCEIIKMQSKLIKKMAIEIGMGNIFTEEMRRINALKERIEAHNE